jgi:hypothetical protein
MPTLTGFEVLVWSKAIGIFVPTGQLEISPAQCAGFAAVNNSVQPAA